ncbi:MAG: hypothetical protein IJU14_02270, partial [Clostridia bacterium]|nr:hypothetical protein [Clostridia bacterium]
MITMMMFLATFVVKAQDTNKNHDNTETTEPMTASYCMSFSDYKDNKWTTVENVVRKTRSIGTKIWSGGGDYSFLAETDELTKLLKKKVFAV